MLDQDDYDTIKQAAIYACFIVFGVVAGCGMGARMERKIAVEKGVAEYYIDENNEKAFRYKEVGD